LPLPRSGCALRQEQQQQQKQQQQLGWLVGLLVG
jgi:hypothetical protein